MTCLTTTVRERVSNGKKSQFMEEETLSLTLKVGSQLRYIKKPMNYFLAYIKLMLLKRIIIHCNLFFEVIILK